MTIYDLKPAFQNLLRPISNTLANAGATANQVTLAAMLLSIIVGALFALYPTERWAALLIPVWLFLRMALNAIDGMLAREHDIRDIKQQLEELERTVSELNATLESQREQLHAHEHRREEAQNALNQKHSELNDVQSRISAHRSRQEHDAATHRPFRRSPRPAHP